MKCIPTSKQKEKNEESYMKLAEEFWKIPEVKQLGEYSIGMWQRLVNTATKGELNENGIPNAEQLKLLKRKMDREVKRLSKTRGGLAKSLYLSEELYKDFEFTRRWYEAVANSAEQYKGHTSFFNAKMQSIFSLLRDASYKEGTDVELKRFKLNSRPKAQKRLQALYKSYNKLKRKGKMEEANYLYETEIVRFLKSGEGQVFTNFHELVTATPKEFEKLSSQYNGNIVSAAKVWRKDIQPEAQKLMVQGIQNYKASLEGSAHLLGDFTKYKPTLETLNNLIRRYKSGELQKNGYFPVLSLDIMPSLAEAAPFLKHSKNEKNFNKGADIISKLETILNDNIYVNKHLKEQSSTSERIDYNVIPIMDSFVRSASRFNFVSFNTAKYMEVLKDIQKTSSKNGPLNEKLEAVTGMIDDTYGIITGERNKGSEGATNFARAITSWQFVSKLGLNIRGATRNATQSLLNWVWFGKKGISEVRTMNKDAEMKSRVDKGLEDNGILFPEIKEVYFEDFAPKVDYNKETGTYQEKLDMSAGDAIVSSINKIAEKAGKPMQWVENNINRRFTFQLGYSLQWKADNARIDGLRRRFDRRLKRRGKDIEAMKNEKATIFKNNDSNKYEFEFEMFRRKRASREGNASVRNLHFDYAMTAKSKVLTSKVGSVLGQFQHYGVNFFNLQRKIIRDGKDDVMTSQWNGEGAWRMYRLGLLYTTMYGIFSPLINADLGNLVQNDTFERLQSYHDAVLSDDEDTRKRAFFGKGPVLGTIGGPFISDLTTIGNLSGLYEMDEDSWAAYLSGYQDMAEESGSEKMKNLVRTLNSQVYRTIYSTYPKWKSGAQFGTLLQGELGLFPTKEVRKRREMLKMTDEKERKAPKTSVDEAILRSLELISKS